MGISCVILAGGINSRFNNIVKANIEINGSSIISRMLDATNGFFVETILVTNTPDNFNWLQDVIIVSDIFPKRGPLGGIHAALKASSCDASFVFAGDMPMLSHKIIGDEIKFYHDRNCDGVIPRIGELIEPLHAIYNKTILTELEKLLIQDGDFAVRKFIKSLNIRYFKLPPTEENKRAFTNINSPEDKLRFESDYPDGNCDR
jgi:molybdenum cofactor guanylyltransferase